MVHDIPQIQRIAAVTWPVTFREILTPEQLAYMMEWMYSTDALRRQMEEQGHVFLLATRTDVAEALPIGYTSYEPGYSGTRTTKIHKLYVCPDVQGLGVGRAFLDTIRATAAAARQQTLTLNVNRYNRAIGFYERYGFVVVGTEGIPIGEGHMMNDVIMELPV